MEAKEVLDFICRRRSVRRFQEKAVPEETLTLLLKAAMAAPSGNNAQPWEFAVVRDPKIKEELSRVHTWSTWWRKHPSLSWSWETKARIGGG